MNKIKNLFKASPIAMVVAGILVAGVASAALIYVYGTLTGTAEVKQSVLIGGRDVNTESLEITYSVGGSPAMAGNTYGKLVDIKNQAEIPAKVGFTTQYMIEGEHGWWDSESGITTSYYETMPSNKRVMVFEGELEKTGGAYSGIILATQDFDVYAKIGSTVVSPASSIDGKLVGPDHDAWPNWDPDVPDAAIGGTGDQTYDGNWYALHLAQDNTWSVCYLNTQGTTTAGCNYNPLSGAIDWGTMYATEDDQNWAEYAEGWDGGAENVELELPGFYVEVKDLGNGEYRVTLTPAELLDGNEMILEPGELTGFTIVNNLAINLAPKIYEIRTNVVPVVPED